MRTFIAVAVLLVLGAGPAGAAPCPQRPPKPKPLPTAAQLALRDAVETRRRFGLRSDRAFVRRLLRDKAALRRGWPINAPLTVREARYFRLRDRVGEAAGRLAAYLEGHPDLSGGLSIEDDFARGPYILVRLTRDQEHHERELKARTEFPDNLRTRLVRLSEAQLDALQTRVDGDTEALAADGFDFTFSSPDMDRQVVEVGVITKRTDAQEYFRQRYGPDVAVVVVATEPYKEVCTAIEVARASSTGRSIKVGWLTNSVFRLRGLRIVETDRYVAVASAELAPSGGYSLAGRYHQRRFRLRRPLGGRPIISLLDGRRIPARAVEPTEAPGGA